MRTAYPISNDTSWYHSSFMVAKNLKTNPKKYAEGKQTRWNNYIPSNRFEFKRDCLQPKFGKIGHSQYIEWFLIARTMYHGLWKFWNRRFFFPLFEWHLFTEINAFAVTCSARWWYQQLRLVISFNFSSWHFRWDEKKLSNFRRIYWNVFVGCQHPKNRLLLMMMTTSSCSLSPLEFFVWICQRDV